MLTFTEFLTEKQVPKSVFESILQYADTTPPVFLTPSLLKRLDYVIPNMKAFHVTTTSGAAELVKKEGSKSTQISVFTNPGDDSLSFEDNLLNGVETEGGTLVEMTGQIDAYFTMDAFTGRLKGGRRSVLIGNKQSKSQFGDSVVFMYNEISPEAGKYVDSLLGELQKELQTIGQKVLNDNLIPFLAKHVPNSEASNKVKRQKDYNEAWMQFQLATNYGFGLLDFLQGNTFQMHGQKIGADRKEAGKIMQSIVREYMDRVEGVFKQVDEYKKIFNMPYRDSVDFHFSGSSLDYDEAVMSNFKIDKLHIYPKRNEKNKPKSWLKIIETETKERIDKPIQVWREPDKLYSYVSKLANKFQDMYTAKVKSV